MNKKLLLAAATIILVLSGCTTKPNIVGQWKLTTFKMGNIDVFESKVLSVFIDDCMKTDTYLNFYPKDENYKFDLASCNEVKTEGTYSYEDGICVFNSTQSDNSFYKVSKGVVTDDKVMTITIPVKDLDFIKELPEVVQNFVDSTSNIIYIFNRVESK